MIIDVERGGINLWNEKTATLYITKGDLQYCVERMLESFDLQNAIVDISGYGTVVYDILERLKKIQKF